MSAPNSQFAEMLREQGMTSGPVYATTILKGHEAARMIADAKAQETIRTMTDRILEEVKHANTGRAT